MYKLGPRSRKNVELLRPDLVKILEVGLGYGVIDFGVPDKSWRTKTDQKELYAQGRTKPGKIVTWTLNSNHILDDEHGFSNAVDCVPFIDGKFVWDEEPCTMVATVLFRAAAELGIKDLQWGYHLWGKDYPHFQITNPKIYVV